MKSYLNLGCGSRFFKEWTNVDFKSNDTSVISHNLSNGIPFESNSFDFVYNSHVLEHFSSSSGKTFIKECFRVLKKNGILRVVVPDLESIASLYLFHLELVKKNKSSYNHDNYEWMKLELYDQTVRNFSGGEIGKLWGSSILGNEDFLEQRVGHEFLEYRRNQINNGKPAKLRTTFSSSSFIFKLKKDFKNFLLKKITNKDNINELINLAEFRLGGEIHQCMYDSYSLSVLLEQSGFEDVKIVDAFSSNLENWNQYMWLDVENGKVRKPDSLFIEARK